MNRSDRQRIDECCGSVISQIDITKLWPKLLKNKVYNRDDVNIPRWTKNLKTQDTVKDIYLTIKTRGPNAFKNLILSLRQSGYGNVADILEGRNSTNNNTSLQQTSHGDVINTFEKRNNDIRREDYFLSHSVWSDKPLKIKLHKATKFLDREYDTIERYPMRSKPRGLVLIITNIYYYSTENPRLSAKHDKDNLRILFEEMGFGVVSLSNLTGQEIKNAVREFSKRDDLEKVDSCFVIFTSHGTEDEENNTEIQGIDYPNGRGHAHYEKILCTDILDYFTAEACPKLAEKPKIFIFQLCRGKRKQKAIPHSKIATDTCVISNTKANESNLDSPRIQTTRNYSDMLVVQSTLPGHVAYRDCVTGSWFIQILCKTFMNYACTHHLQDLFSMIDAELKFLRTMSNECQTSTVLSNGFNKHCYLNPGLFEES